MLQTSRLATFLSPTDLSYPRVVFPESVEKTSLSPPDLSLPRFVFPESVEKTSLPD